MTMKGLSTRCSTFETEYLLLCMNKREKYQFLFTLAVFWVLLCLSSCLFDVFNWNYWFILFLLTIPRIFFDFIRDPVCFPSYSYTLHIKKVKLSTLNQTKTSLCTLLHLIHLTSKANTVIPVIPLNTKGCILDVKCTHVETVSRWTHSTETTASASCLQITC